MSVQISPKNVSKCSFGAIKMLDLGWMSFQTPRLMSFKADFEQRHKNVLFSCHFWGQFQDKNSFFDIFFRLMTNSHEEWTSDALGPNIK